MKALVTGATGFVGRRLVATLEGSVVLSRDAEKARASLRVAAFAWQPEREVAPLAAFDGVDVVFNLLGEPVAGGRWTAEKKARIRQSRVLGTQNLVRALEALPPTRRPQVLVSGSAVGIYGDRGDEVLDESSAPGQGFLADVCREWEEAARGAERLGVRVVRARIGLVLGPGGGALAEMRRPFELGLGGKLGNGRQWMPWIHVDDVVGLLRHAALSDGVRGAIAVVGPAPVQNADFTRALGRAVHRPAILPVPRFALKLALGELGDVVFQSQRVMPRVARESGYTFRHPTLDEALSDALLRRPAPREVPA